MYLFQESNKWKRLLTLTLRVGDPFIILNWYDHANKWELLMVLNWQAWTTGPTVLFLRTLATKLKIYFNHVLTQTLGDSICVYIVSLRKDTKR